MATAVHFRISQAIRLAAHLVEIFVSTSGSAEIKSLGIRTARKAGPRDGDRIKVMFLAKAGLAAAVVDAAVGGPAVGRSGHIYPFYWIDPGSTPSGRLSPQKARHTPSSHTKPLNPAVPQTSKRGLACPVSERTHLICG